MDAQDIRRLRLDLLDGRLNGVARAIGLGQHGFDWSRQEFSNQITERRNKVTQEKSGRAADNRAWHGWANQEASCEPLFREALAWLQAAGIPAFEQTGPAALARGLVDELLEYCGLGVTPIIAPDVDDSFSDFVQIIRLRFPPADIWDIPIVAHEFGHFTVLSRSGLGQQQELKDYINSKRDPAAPQEHAKLTHRLNEFFADIFATYALGPAFAMSALLLRFDVAQAYNDSDMEHPSFAARAVAILETMARLRSRRPALQEVNAWLAAKWENLLAHAESPEALDDVKAIAADLFGIVCRIAPNARYDGWPDQPNKLYNILTSDAPAPANTSARDLLNAGWMALTYGADPTQISLRVLQLWGRHG